jgi:diadenosine tetraphosphate (Ap4A) HIT family hydrolase
MNDTAIHRLVGDCRKGIHPSCVTRTSSGWVILAERQVLPGYCLLLPDPVVPHLNALDGAVRAAFLADMATVGDALLALTGAIRINYAIFGNQEPALHAHVFPRYADEPASMRAVQPWALDWAAAPACSQDMYGELKVRLREAIESVQRA